MEYMLGVLQGAYHNGNFCSLCDLKYTAAEMMQLMVRLNVPLREYRNRSFVFFDDLNAF